MINHAAAAAAAAAVAAFAAFSKNMCLGYEGGILTSSLMINIAISLDCSAKSLETDERAVYLSGGCGLEVRNGPKKRGEVLRAAHPSEFPKEIDDECVPHSGA
jgi:hypothetical protein